MKNFTRKDGFSELSLLQAGIDHFVSAKVLFDANTRCFDSAGYLCHLGIELVLKAMLLHKCDEFPDVHSLTKLSELIESQGAKIDYTEEHSEVIRMLDHFYKLRYPNPAGPVEIGDDRWEAVEILFDHLILMFPEQTQHTLKHMDHSIKDNRVLMKKKRVT